MTFIIQNGCMIAHHHQLLGVEHQIRTQDDIVVVHHNIFTYIYGTSYGERQQKRNRSASPRPAIGRTQNTNAKRSRIT